MSELDVHNLADDVSILLEILYLKIVHSCISSTLLQTLFPIFLDKDLMTSSPPLGVKNVKIRVGKILKKSKILTNLLKMGCVRLG